MRKKIYKFVSVTVIAVAMTVSFQMSKAKSATTLTMENIEAVAMAVVEYGGSDGICCHTSDDTCVWDDGFNLHGWFI